MDSSPAAPAIRVVDFNVRYDVRAVDPDKKDPQPWLERREQVVELLRGFDADLIGLQECRHGQYEWLKQQLGNDYDTYGLQSTRDPAGFDLTSEYCPVWWRRDRFTLEGSGMIWLNARHERGRPITWPLDPRLCTVVRLLDALAGRSLWFYCTHFDNVPYAFLNFHGNRWHRSSVGWILEHMRARDAREGGVQPTVLVGDMNMTADKRAHGLLAEYLEDAYCCRPSQQDPREGTCHRMERGVGPHIDYIWAGGGLKPVHYRIHTDEVPPQQRPPTYYSDHFPLVAELEWETG
jgi:endonuclease/exonuclease/phosphatase family metal-dependent hydrolase